MKKIFYIHGAFSMFSTDSNKIIELNKDFDVYGENYSMERPFNENLKMLTDAALACKADVIMGTSLGGVYAASVAKALNKDSLLVNPPIKPKSSIKKLIGSHKNYGTGVEEVFTSELAETFIDEIEMTSSSYVFVGMKDTVVPPEATIEFSREKGANLTISLLSDHRWDDFAQNDLIKSL